jgi:site-specific DNA-methyltransferase (adenine-specific)
MAVKRLALAEEDSTIQGYTDGYFWERNTLADQKPVKPVNHMGGKLMGLFDD